jgi:ABC-2 type transport system ATP-binding protein
MADNEYYIETVKLTKTFRDFWLRERVTAVSDLDLRVGAGEVFGLLGPNGSGKSTTLKMILGLLFPTRGRIAVFGRRPTDVATKARIGFLPEESYLYPFLDARETLDFYGRLFGLPAKVRKMRIEALLDMVGLKAVANRAVGTFSKGMARRIGLAQALINDPDLLILDEPTTGLDPIGTRQIKDLILKLAERGKTILLCSHLLADVEDVCDRIAILYGGKIQTQGRVRELLQQTNKRQITTDAISDSTVEKIKQLVAAEDAECVVTSPMDKLESFFIRTVTAAQQQAQPTSGAVSTTKIGDFLTRKEPAESILDKLVSAPVSQQASEQTPATENVVAAPSSASGPDENLLSKLTRPAEPPQLKPVARDETAATEAVEPQASGEEQVRESILDKLTGRSAPQSKNKEKTDKSQAGDSGDA